MAKLESLNKNYYKYLDKKARHIAHLLAKNKPVTRLVLSYITELYRGAKAEYSFRNNSFEVAYHAPISSDLEFLLARILYHYSNSQDLKWKIYLRRQIGKTAPDIRIAKGGKTVAIVEVKAKAGWIQPFFSSERAKKDMKKLRAGTSDFDPRDLIKKVRKQITKYSDTFEIKPERVFVLLPSLELVHRKKSTRKLDDYESDFAKNSGLGKHNLIILSQNLSLDLSSNPPKRSFQPTRRFEEFVELLEEF